MKNKLRIWLCILVLLLLLASLQIMVASRQKLDIPYHFDSASPHGAKGFYLLLQQVGFETVRVHDLQTESGTGIWIVPDEDEVWLQEEELWDWLSQGNGLVIIGDPQIEYWFSPPLEEAYEQFMQETTDPHPLRYFDYYHEEGLLRLVPEGDQICDNQHLRQKDNAVQLINLLRDFEGQKILLKEAGFGSIPQEAETIWQAIPTAGWLVVLQLLAGMYWWFKARTKYLGEPVAMGQIGGLPAEDEDIIALGRLLQSHQQHEAVLAWLYQIFREQAAGRIGVAAGEENRLFLEQVNREFPGDAESLRAIHQLLAEERITPKDLLFAEQALNKLRERWLKVK